MQNIRNFSIIAHIDHGKSTLADRMLEITKTIESRKMRNQILDSMELEQERGITIKMQPIRMKYQSEDGNDYVLNMIDTPGHIDFSYEVSRAIKAVDGSILLVDATQGVQAQTFTTLNMAREANLTIIPVITKIDSPLARIDEVKEEISELIECNPEDVLCVSGKTGGGVKELLDEIVKKVPGPKDSPEEGLKGLVFSFEYSDHRGVIIHTRIFSGKVKKGDSLFFAVSGKKFIALEVGTFRLERESKDELGPGEIGYIVTGIKEPNIASVGDTVTTTKNPSKSLPGYRIPSPVVWASIYLESQDDFSTLRLSLSRLQLSDSSFTYEEEASGVLGRGFRCGFLGMLHLEIITERLRREFQLELIVTSPSVTYIVKTKKDKDITVYSPLMFPEYGDIVEVMEPWIKLNIITPSRYLGSIMQLLFEHEGEVTHTENFGDNRNQLYVGMPLRELMRNFFDNLKSISSGFASISYVMEKNRPADVVRMDVLVAGEIVPAFSKIVARRRVEEEAEKTVLKLEKHLPRQMFVIKIQARAFGRILSSATLRALRKDVTAKLYGGDITRKMKLREKQKKGKKKMKEIGKVNIPGDVFIKMMK